MNPAIFLNFKGGFYTEATNQGKFSANCEWMPLKNSLFATAKTPEPITPNLFEIQGHSCQHDPSPWRSWSVPGKQNA
jgi:hypothetical protein